MQKWTIAIRILEFFKLESVTLKYNNHNLIPFNLTNNRAIVQATRLLHGVVQRLLVLPPIMQFQKVRM
jgi:hypothetical protein